MSSRAIAARSRRALLQAAASAGTCHIGSSLSIVDVLAVLYGEVLRPGVDRFLLSKGHAASALYAVLAEVGTLDPAELARGYCVDGGSLAGHPERGTPGVEMTAGSLGHGPAIAIGLALAVRSAGSDARTFCLLGDGELDEGSVWEAFALAGHLELGSLVAIVDANGLQGLGTTGEVLSLEPLPERLAAFGFDTVELDGHDHGALASALRTRSRRPRAIVARTTKGKGVDFMEDELMWHYRPLRGDDLERALAQIPAMGAAA